MKDYFSVTYTHFINSQAKSIKDINSLKIPKSFVSLDSVNNKDDFYGFRNIQGIDVSFSLFNNSLIEYIENGDEDLLGKIEQKYSIKDNLMSYYHNMVIQGKIFRDELYVYNVIYIENEICPGYYETNRILSILEIPSPEILLTKITLDGILSVEQKGIILTQKNSVSYSDKLFIQI